MREKLFRRGDQSICPKSPMPVAASSARSRAAASESAKRLVCGSSTAQGWNSYMEDRIICIEDISTGGSIIVNYNYYYFVTLFSLHLFVKISHCFLCLMGMVGASLQST